MVMLPVQAQAWVSDLVLSFPDQCWEIFLLTESYSTHTIVLPSFCSHLHANGTSLALRKAAQETVLPLARPGEGPSMWKSDECCAW